MLDNPSCPMPYIWYGDGNTALDIGETSTGFDGRQVFFPFQEVVLLPRELLPEQGGAGRGSYDIHCHHAGGILPWDCQPHDDLHEEGISFFLSLYLNKT